MDLPRLIVLDLDGTLLPESKRLTRRSIAVLGALRERGVQVTLATGKFLHLSRHYAKALDLEAPVIALDGARVCRNGSVSVRGIQIDAAREILEDLLDPQWDCFGDNGGDELLLKSSHPLLRRISSIWAERIHEVGQISTQLQDDPGVLVAYGPVAEIEESATHIRDRFPALRTTTTASPLMGGARVTIQPPETSKGTGVRFVLDQYGFEAHECMVFGDWNNDVPMFEIGCVNVAMANAVPELTALAEHTTEHTSDDDGVARFLEAAFLNP